MDKTLTKWENKVITDVFLITQKLVLTVLIYMNHKNCSHIAKLYENCTFKHLEMEIGYLFFKCLDELFKSYKCFNYYFHFLNFCPSLYLSVAKLLSNNINFFITLSLTSLTKTGYSFFLLIQLLSFS